jgi:hypothetical protein
MGSLSQFLNDAQQIDPNLRSASTTRSKSCITVDKLQPHSASHFVQCASDVSLVEADDVDLQEAIVLFLLVHAACK